MTAIFAADDFSLREDWAQREFRFQQQLLLKEVKGGDFLQAVCLISTYFRRSHHLKTISTYDRESFPAVSCSGRDLLNLSYKEYQQWAEEESQLWTMAFSSHQSSELVRIKFFGRSLPTYNLHKQRAKICPCCLELDSYCRKLWNLIPLTACPIHHCLLVDICPQRDRQIRWDRNSVTHCKYCKLDWRSIQPEILRGCLKSYL